MTIGMHCFLEKDIHASVELLYAVAVYIKPFIYMILILFLSCTKFGAYYFIMVLGDFQAGTSLWSKGKIF